MKKSIPQVIRDIQSAADRDLLAGGPTAFWSFMETHEEDRGRDLLMPRTIFLSAEAAYLAVVADREDSAADAEVPASHLAELTWSNVDGTSAYAYDESGCCYWNVFAVTVRRD